MFENLAIISKNNHHLDQ